jgi:MobA/MobL family
MALYRFEAKVISRSDNRSTLNAAAYRTGKSAASAAAYRHGTQLTDERTGQTYDYSRKRGIQGSEILITAGAPAWASDREKLWNEVERVEKRKDSQLARDFVISLPHELDAEQRRALLTDFLDRNFVDKGYLCDVAFHAPHGKGDDRNHHAHVMVPMRRLDANGFAKKKDRPEGNPHDAWQTELAHWRKDWADTTNRHLEAAGRLERVSHLSLVEQGIDRQPEPKQGPIATEIEREGRESHAGSDRRQVQAENADRAKLKADMANVVNLAVEIIRRGKVEEVTDAQASEQPRRISEAAAHLQGQEAKRQQEQARDDFKKRTEQQAEEARKEQAKNQTQQQTGDAAVSRPQQDAAQRNGDIADATTRYRVALGNHYDVHDPYASLARAAMAEYGAFAKQQEELRQQAAAEKDPAKRHDIDLRRRIEGHEYMAITEHRIAGLSDDIARRENSPRGIVAHAQADIYQDEANKLRAERGARQAEREQPARGTGTQPSSRTEPPNTPPESTRGERQDVAQKLGDLAKAVSRGELADKDMEMTDAKAERIARMEADGAAAKARHVAGGRTGGRGGGR